MGAIFRLDEYYLYCNQFCTQHSSHYPYTKRKQYSPWCSCHHYCLQHRSGWRCHYLHLGGTSAETSTAYPLGKNVVRVKAVDSTGAESSWAAIVFFVADPNRGGGMTLTGPESVILEQGISGATITNYTFTVPPVSGHSGNDYGRVRGYNILTGSGISWITEPPQTASPSAVHFHPASTVSWNFTTTQITIVCMCVRKDSIVSLVCEH